ncbi:MAG: HTTM domain-containing protein [Candidatus Promineofilum sp.]|nr:HTTM domain-containing protein [Promineifilum sp.]
MTGISLPGRRAARTDGGRPAALRVALSRPVDIGPLIVLRVAFGLLMCAGAVRFMALGWIRDLYVTPRFHFTYYGFGWVRPLPEWGMWLVFIALAGLGLCIAAGLAYRAGMAAFFILFTYVELLDQTTYLNHYYFISVLSLWLLFLPLNGRYALDNRLGLAPLRATVPAWMVWGVRAQVGLVYFFAGAAKLNGDWLFAAQPLRIWLHARTTTPYIGGLFDYAWVAYAMSWAGAAFDLTIPFWLSWPPARRPAYGAVIVFHTLTGVLFHIGLFPWIMIACTLVFFDWRLPELGGGPAGGESPSFRPPPRWLPAALLLLLALQIALPLRHWLYPGDVNWTEEGGRWAWRVMIVEKTGQVTFLVRDKASGGESVVFPGEYLTDLQEKQMSFQPDMIAQFARFLGRERGGDVEVRARAYVSWNGRPSRLLIAPDYDLLQASPGPRPKPWIMR